MPSSQVFSPETTTKLSIPSTHNPISTCSRISIDGIEMYWNGSNCVNALSYEKICNASDECKYLTQNTSCYGPALFRCQCSLSEYFNYITDKMRNAFINKRDM